jgi:hypothetical protein
VSPNPKDPYEQFQDSSTTPFLDLFIDIVLMVSVAGGSLAVLLAIGYLAQDSHRSRAWPFLAVVAVLMVANVGLRAIRSRLR